MAQNPHDLFGMPTDDGAIGLDPKETFLALGVAIGGVAIPPNDQGFPPGAALVLTFLHACPQHTGAVERIRFVVAEHSGLPPLSTFVENVAQAVEVATDPDKLAYGQSRALDLMAAHMAARDPRLAARCPGCGARLFGDVAARGACLACFPEAPPDAVLDQAARLDAGGPA